MLLAMAAMMAVMMAASAVPAFALPPNPIDEFKNHGQRASFFARTLPPNPIGQLNHGRQVSLVARGLPVACGPDVDVCPNP